MTSGTSANGMPNESTTWEMTSVREGSSPMPITTNAGIIVTIRRTNSGIRRRMNPCITTWPDSVPMVELERPEAVRASANSTLEAPPRIGSIERLDVVQAAPEEDGGGDHQHRYVDESGQGHGDQDVEPRVAVERFRLLVVLRDDPLLRQGRVEADHVRHHRRAEDADGEQHRLVAGEVRDDGMPTDRAERRVREPELAEVADADHEDEGGDHGFERAEAVALEPQEQERDHAGDHGGGEERDPEQQLDPDSGAEELR